MSDRKKHASKLTDKIKFAICPIYVRQETGRVNISVRIRKREIEADNIGYHNIRCMVHDKTSDRPGEWINFNSGAIERINTLKGDAIEIVLKAQ